jgi:diguanylate cyclase (GGDEF)-like protein
MRLRRDFALIVTGLAAAGWIAYRKDQAHADEEEIFYLAVYTLLTGLAWWAALGLRSRGSRAPWVLLAAFETSWWAGDIVGNAGDLLFKGKDYAWLDTLQWISQGAYWIGYVAIFAMLIIMVRRRAPGQLLAGSLDGLILATAIGMVVWQFLVLPQLVAPDFDVKSFGFAMYPIADVVVIAAALLLALAPGQRGVATRLLLGGVLLIMSNDLGYNIVSKYFPDHVGRLTAVALFSNVIMVAVALHQNRAELTTPVRQARHLHAARVVFLGIALLTAPAMSLTDPGTAWAGERALLLAGSVLTSVFILVRFTSAVRDQESIRQELAYQAAHDALTGLTNRRSLTQHLHHALHTGDQHAVLLYVDLDGFKAVNDGAGHAAGDAVLAEVARRLQNAVRKTDIVARLGGDEFAVLCPGLIPLDTATDLAQRVLDSLTEPVVHAGHAHRVGASIGIAVPTSNDIAVTGQDVRAEHLLRTADHAMFEAKRLGKGRFVVAHADDHLDVSAAA